MKRLWRAAAALIAVTFVAVPLSAQESQSSPLARQLVTLMAGQKLSAIAARDPSTPDRFVAALLFPDVQLLVVSARYIAPSLLQEELAQKRYSEVYATLQQAAIQESKVFFQDLKADGLHAKPVATVDIMYERAVKQTIFDGDPAKRQMTEQAYAEAFKAADTVYSRLLSLLIGELKEPTQTR